MRAVGTRARAARAGLALALLAAGACGDPPDAGEIRGTGLPRAVVRERAARQAEPAALRAGETGAPAAQILFGDLHVHTTFSYDAFVMNLPILGGEGVHPAGDACDFARYCSDLDFWSINDHAETLTPRAWRETLESVRACQARAGDPRDPDLVTFLGWEWTQVGRTPETHYGHKNVIFRDLDPDRVPARPIAAPSIEPFEDLFQPSNTFLWALKLPLLDFADRGRYFDLLATLIEMGRNRTPCPEGVDTRELPDDCMEVALQPDLLFEKLAQWGFESLVIPHGTSWGWYTPPGSGLEHQLAGRSHDPQRQTLIEVYSGHGNSEEHRDWRAATRDAAGEPVCPAPSDEYLPCCWQAGEIIRTRCEDPASETCERRVADARRNHLALGSGGHLAVSGESVEDWLDCGQCRDCFAPAFNYRPGGSAQYALAVSNFEDGPDDPRRFRFGFIASSDNHTARPGTGYKEYDRIEMTEAHGPRDAAWVERIFDHRGEPAPESLPRSAVRMRDPMFNFLNPERGASFFLTGGLVAAHAAGRDRGAIWEALGRREVYGTSGPRILLWFDLLNGPGGARLPMGSEVALDEAPRFEVRAAGAFVQKPGCPAHGLRGLGPERLERLCHGECYHPSDERHRIERIEIVRIRPQVRDGEPVGPLVEDPWRRFECPPDPAGCRVSFQDPAFPAAGREVIYYARAVQEQTPAVNGAGLRCEFDARGRCVRVRPCYADPRTPADDDCLADIGERAWASPIFVRPADS